ncbi:MAG: thioredoxin family protein, partial [Acidobacteria bacterium]|nr:thioredoxin family protein [Acidobacteriota bacterium]
LADLQQRVERGETVFIDFTADWCWSCKVNERTVLASSGVQARLRDLNVTTVKADWTRRNPEITRLLAKFGRVGVPFYVVFPANRLSQPVALSEIITPASVIDALDRAGPSITVRNPDGTGL